MPVRVNLKYIINGFSLLEMAIVLAIVGLLLASLLPNLSAQMEQQRRADTAKQSNEIRDAIYGYAIINGRLPCPAIASAVSGANNWGIADCTQTTGVIPWVTLGVTETDAWGRRLTYSVSSDFINANFTLTTTGELNVKTAASAGTNLVTSTAAVIVSHGSNGWGAYTPQGTQMTVSSSADEADNSNLGLTFVSHDFTPTFDDLVVWIPPNILFNRMVTAGKLP